MNIKNEVLVSTSSWIFFSIVYFVTAVGLGKNGEKDKFKDLAFFGIVLRDLATTCGISLFTIHNLSKNQDEEVLVDPRLADKLRSLDFNTVIKHSLPFSYFKAYIQKTEP